MKKYQPKEIEEKWQERWRQEKIYDFRLNSEVKPFYNLVELPYTSGDLHIGHWFTFTPTDAFARFKKMCGQNVFYPIGFDAFGLPAENAAIKNGVHPQEWTLSNVKHMSEQFQKMGTMIDWHHQVVTCTPQYYRWNQWIFIKMFEKGIAYLDKALLNWCPVDQTVLADENIEAGKCWRCGSTVEKKEVQEWFLRITNYAGDLIWPKNPGVDWPKSVREGQNNWIGKKEGINISYKVEGLDEEIVVFTTRPDTNFGATFIALAPEHPLISKLTKPEQSKSVQQYLKQAASKTEQERKENREKTGIFTGSFAVNELNGYRMPIWISDFVLMEFGTGALVGVPGHDLRDFEFAKKFGLEIKRVVVGKDGDKGEITKLEQVQESEGIMINSSFLDDLGIHEATKKIMEYMEKKGYGKKVINYHLRDWSISRQRYWGTPVPIIHCQKCGLVPVKLEDLPLELPFNVDFTPKGKSPLESNEEWMSANCPKCGSDAKRDGQTLDGFFDNSWYFYRYIDPNYQDGPFSPDLAQKLMPLDIYFGGAEHTLGHTLYSRFFTRFFKELGLIEFDEYALKRIQHGVILGPDGHRMSKSRGNVVNPDDEVSKYGADAIRLYLAFIGPYDVVTSWNSDNVNGVYHFLQRIWSLFDKISDQTITKDNDLRMLNKTIKKVTEDLEELKFNTAVASLMEWLNYLSRKDSISKEEFSVYLKLLAPFAPHITEELWQLMGREFSIHQQTWPEVDRKYLEDIEITLAIQINGKLRDTILVSTELISDKDKVEKTAMEQAKIKKHLEGVKLVKTIYIPGKILNFVVNSLQG